MNLCVEGWGKWAKLHRHGSEQVDHLRVCHDEILRPLDGADIDTPRGERAKQEVRRLRGMIEQRVLGGKPRQN